MNRLHVLIPTFNCGKYISETIRSIFEQGCEDIRITVVDNCSTDNTRQLIQSEFGDSVEYVCNDTNIGGIRNHNRCFELAAGKYIKLLSADDILLPGILNAQMAAFDAHPEVGVVTCDCNVIDSTGTWIGEARYLGGLHAGDAAIRACTAKVSNFIGGPSNTMLRGSVVEQSRWDPAFAWTADLMFYCELLTRSMLMGTGEIGVAYRRRSGSISDSICPVPVRRRSDLEFLKRFSRDPLTYARWAVRYAKAGLK